MSDKRVVKFLYFKPYLFDVETMENKGAFNFADWIAEYSEQGKILNSVYLDGFIARVEEYKYDAEADLHGVCFVHMRGENLPSKAGEGRAQEDLDLEEDEYIGEDMYILYDRKTNIFMMQINRNAMTIVRIAEFINWTRKYDGNKVGFIPMTRQIAKKEMKRKKVRTIELSCESVQQPEKMKSKTLKKICDTTGDIGCNTYAMRFSVGRRRYAELSPEESQNMIDDIMNRTVNVNTAKVTWCDDITGEIEYVDLVENKLMSKIGFTVSGKERLQMDAVFAGMKKEYLQNVFIDHTPN